MHESTSNVDTNHQLSASRRRIPSAYHNFSCQYGIEQQEGVGSPLLLRLGLMVVWKPYLQLNLKQSKTVEYTISQSKVQNGLKDENANEIQKKPDHPEPSKLCSSNPTPNPSVSLLSSEYTFQRCSRISPGILRRFLLRRSGGKSVFLGGRRKMRTLRRDYGRLY